MRSAAFASGQLASAQIQNMERMRSDGSGLSPPAAALTISNWTAAALKFITASEAAQGYNNLALLACSPVHASLSRQKINENLDKFEKMWASVKVDADNRAAVRDAVIKSLIQEASARLTAIKKDADVLHAISQLKAVRIRQRQCHCGQVHTAEKGEEAWRCALTMPFSSPSLLFLFRQQCRPRSRRQSRSPTSV